MSIPDNVNESKHSDEHAAHTILLVLSHVDDPAERYLQFHQYQDSFLALTPKQWKEIKPQLETVVPGLDVEELEKMRTNPLSWLDVVEPCSYVANARRIQRYYKNSLYYVPGLGWIMWNGKFWEPDPTKDDDLTAGYVSKLSRFIALEAGQCFRLAGMVEDKAQRDTLLALGARLGEWAKDSEFSKPIYAGLKFAKRGRRIQYSALNKDAYLFNCANGTLNLKTGELQPHSSQDFITHMAPVEFDSKATCPTWEKFLGEVFPNDPEMVAFIQRAFGYSLVGEVKERVLFFLYGATGANGKTTMVELLRDLLGLLGENSFGYARKVHASTFMQSKNMEEDQRKAANLVGARFIVSSEIGEGQHLNESLIKDMTGRDTLAARRLYKEPFNFLPVFKPWMYGNHKPIIRGTDNAIWKRVLLIEFVVSFAENPDHELPKKLRRELSGILNWAVQGCQEWEKNGLQAPAKVLQDTQEYRIEQDDIGRFIQEKCEIGDFDENATNLHEAYFQWCTAQDLDYKSQTAFGIYLTHHGYSSDKNRTGNGVRRQGLRLKGSLQSSERPIGPQYGQEDIRK